MWHTNTRPRPSTGVRRSAGIRVRADIIRALHRGPDLVYRKLRFVAHLYADDTQAYGSCLPAAADSLFLRVSECADAISTWMKSNRLQLNPDKSEVLWCATGRRQHEVPTSAVLIAGVPVTPEMFVRDLGIYIDADLSMRMHV